MLRIDSADVPLTQLSQVKVMHVEATTTSPSLLDWLALLGWVSADGVKGLCKRTREFPKHRYHGVLSVSIYNRRKPAKIGL